MKIAILLTCFNRKPLTLSCLQQLHTALSTVSNIDSTIYLVDDGSTDGTGEAVASAYPDIIILHGTGHLFWNGGMSLAFSKAISVKYDYYLWLNDDTLLYSDSFQKAATTLQEYRSQAVIFTGATEDAETHEITYGGVKKRQGLHPFKYDLIEPANELVACDTINGNFTLISQKTVNILGNLDPHYTHAFGDYDYGLRAKKARIPMFLFPHIIGTCSLNSTKETWQDTSLTLREKWIKRFSPTALPHKDWKYFCKMHGGIFKIFWTYAPYIKLIISSICRRRRNTQ